MRSLTTLVAVAALSVGGVAVAQETAPAEPAPAPEAAEEAAPAAEAAAPALEAEAEVAIMTGESVYNLEGEEIGEIEEVTAGADGTQSAIISVGEFLGLGGKQVMIPASELSARAEGGYTVNYTQEQLEQMPEHEGAEN